MSGRAAASYGAHKCSLHIGTSLLYVFSGWVSPLVLIYHRSVEEMVLPAW